MHPDLARGRGAHRPARATTFGALLLLLAGSGASSARPAVLGPPGAMQLPLAVNRISMQVANCGYFATDPIYTGGPETYGGLEFPRGSGKYLAYAGGLWLSGRAAGSLRTAISEYATEFVPGPGVSGGPGLDSLNYRVFSVSRADTAGAAAWMARGVPLGAPVDSTGTKPGLLGDQTLWTIDTDAGVTSQVYGRGARTPIGLEVQLTAYAFDRAPVLQDVVFLHWRLVHRGTDTLDSAYVGLWFDADMRSAHTPIASDTSLDLGYGYRTNDDTQYGVAGPSIGVLSLHGPYDAVSGADLRPTSIVAWPNGIDPANAVQDDAVMQGYYPWGAAMIDSTTGLPTHYYATGDPVAGTGWLMPQVWDPKFIVAAGPITFAPGDTQVVDAAVVVGQGADRAGSVVALRANAVEARDAFRTRFANVPAWQPPPPPPPVQLATLVARPVPARGTVALEVLVPAGGAEVELDVFDARGHRVRHVADAWHASGVASLTWDGLTENARLAPTGVYFARARVAGETTRARIVLIR